MHLNEYLYSWIRGTRMQIDVIIELTCVRIDIIIYLNCYGGTYAT